MDKQQQALEAATEEQQASPVHLFTHAPRQVITSETHPNQRRFGAGQNDAYAGTNGIGRQRANASVYRDGECAYAELQVDIGVGCVSSASVSLHLDARGLRDLARRLIDAAHDLEPQPVTTAKRDLAEFMSGVEVKELGPINLDDLAPFKAAAANLTRIGTLAREQNALNEEELLAKDRAYAKAKDDGSLQRMSDDRALADQIRHSTGEQS